VLIVEPRQVWKEAAIRLLVHVLAVTSVELGTFYQPDAETGERECTA
tara:strand:- start:932 stop:1072 length:141 start_codon:yes stop_codon:yes gene_type:complete